MKTTAQTAKAKAEAKFKMVGTKLNEQGLADFEAKMAERGFKTPSAYVRYLIEFDAADSVEEERKQNEILTRTNEVLRARIEELEKSEQLYFQIVNGQTDLISQNNGLLKFITAKVKESEEEPKKSFLERLWGLFK